MKSIYGVMLKFLTKRCHFSCSIINLPIHSADVITAYQQLIWEDTKLILSYTMSQTGHFDVSHDMINQ